MSKTMLINVTHAEESRVGIVEDGQLESFEIESLSREHLKGNIYKGIVRRIHPAIEAAFVDIGADRDAFLPLDEICFRNLPSGRNGSSSGGDKGRRRIKEVLKSGDEVLVQIVKEQFTNKPPTLSTFYSLPGRYLVLLPGSDDAGISRKIEGEERMRIRELIGSLKPPPGCGIIVRTAAGFDEQSGELERDLNYLQRLWASIKKHADTRRAPCLVYREHDLVLRTIRDYFTPDINQIFIDNEEVCERAKDFLHNVMPGKEHLLQVYEGAQPIFSHFGVEAQIESIYKRRVALRSGGSIVIDGTEALTAIDVNSGGSMRGGSQEETAHKTNLEAANEIARQLRLRDLGGIIVVDFIDMRTPSHITDVERALRDAMRADKARHDIGRISRLGLLEVSRQRLRPAAAASSYTACPMCEGHGAVRTTESAALVTLRKVHHRISEGDVAQMRVGLPREVAMYLLNQKRDDLAVLEARYDARIQVVVDDKLMPHQSEIETRTRDVTERAPLAVVRPGEAGLVSAPAAATPARRAAAGRSAPQRSAEKPAAARASRAAVGESVGEDGKRRRRRRGGRDRKAAAGSEAAPALDVPAVAATGESPAQLDASAEPSSPSTTVERGRRASDWTQPETSGVESELAAFNRRTALAEAAVGAEATQAERVTEAGEVRVLGELADESPIAPVSDRVSADDDRSPETTWLHRAYTVPTTDADDVPFGRAVRDEPSHLVAETASDASGDASVAQEDSSDAEESESSAAGSSDADADREPVPADAAAPEGEERAPRRRRRRGGRRGGRGRRGRASGSPGAQEPADGQPAASAGAERSAGTGEMSEPPSTARPMHAAPDRRGGDHPGRDERAIDDAPGSPERPVES